jgi:hypothetical protein
MEHHLTYYYIVVLHHPPSPPPQRKKNNHCMLYTDKKGNKIFLINKEIQNGAVERPCMTNGLLIYGEILPFLIYDFASNCSTRNFLIYEENFIFFFISVGSVLLNPGGRHDKYLSE